jgi:hypothetical protein
MRETRTSGSTSGSVETEHGSASEAPADERAGERTGRTYTTAPPPDSTERPPSPRKIRASSADQWPISIEWLGDVGPGSGFPAPAWRWEQNPRRRASSAAYLAGGEIYAASR